jgi:hypothetical protein
MRRSRLAALALTVLLGAWLATPWAWSVPKSSPGCPRNPPKEGSPCRNKHADCHWRCEGEDHSDIGCSCAKDAHGAWRWQCASIGGPCTL